MSPSLTSKAIASCHDIGEARALMRKVEASTDLQSPYSISIPLLGAAYLNDGKRYGRWKEALLQAFKIGKEESEDSIVEKLQEKASTNAWILGRLLVADLRMGDQSSAQKNVSIMEKLLKKSAVDRFSAWAWGYLAIFYAQVKPKEYPLVQKQMLETTDVLMRQPGEKGKDNVLWALVMQLQSFADIGDKVGYFSCLQKMQEFSGTLSVQETLESIPAEDFRAWATSLVLRAAKKIPDRFLEHILLGYLPKTIAASPSDGDKMLALFVRCSN